MKIYSDVLTSSDIEGNTPDHVYANVTTRGSRKRAHAFTVYLEYLGERVKGDGRIRRPNTPGTAGGLNSALVGSITATYDEHGEWMAKLFEIDPDAIISTYHGVEDFYRQTQKARAGGFFRHANFPWLEVIV